MDKSLRVLHVEDSERDVAVLTRHLTRAGYELISERVETPAKMRAALETSEFDVILCDYSMPHFNALQALALLKEMELDLPFIVISGTVGEAVAVEAVRAGAHDYLMKDNLVRLVPTVERELHEAENHRARRRAEAALKASEGELHALFEAMSDVIVVVDSDGRYLKVAPTKSANVYIPAADRMGKTVHDVFPTATADLFVASIRTALAGGQMQKVEYGLSIDGREIWFEASVSPLAGNTALVIARNITERKHAEKALRESEERYRLLFERNPQPMWVFDLETLSFLEVNDAAIHHYGYSREEFLAMTIKDIRPQEDLPELLANLSGAAPQHEEAGIWKHKKKDDTIIDVEISAHELTFYGRTAQIVLAYDVTERRSLEEQLLQAHKMEAIGTLAGGIAHDFNNILAAIIGYTELAQMDIAEAGPAQTHLEQVLMASARAKDLVRQILTFSRQEEHEPKALRLQPVIDDTLKLLRVSLPSTIEIRQDIDAAAPSVLGDVSQIQQVIMNLCVNAGQAMKEHGGVLAVRLTSLDLNPRFASAHSELKEGPHVCLKVSDTGCGMDRATQRRIFDPFFTTKAPGEGTGLGLAVVHGIIKNHHGAVAVSSEPGVGTSFNIYLPVHDGQAGDMVHKSIPVPRGNGEHILFVDDEQALVSLRKSMLENLGYRVTTRTDGVEALAVFSAHPEDFDLVITDQTMPHMNGTDLALALLQIRPELPVILTTGYSSAISVEKAEALGITELLFKPNSMQTLGEAIQRALGETGKE